MSSDERHSHYGVNDLEKMKRGGEVDRRCQVRALFFLPAKELSRISRVHGIHGASERSLAAARRRPIETRDMNLAIAKQRTRDW